MIGIAALLTVYLDYKWWDKRKSVFKRGRNWLIGTMIFILIGSVYITCYDESEQDKEKEKLNTKLSDMKDKLRDMEDSLSVIKKIGVDLKKQIEPILNLAKEKYPQLPIDEALRKLKFDIVELQIQTKPFELDFNKSDWVKSTRKEDNFMSSTGRSQSYFIKIPKSKHGKNRPTVTTLMKKDNRFIHHMNLNGDIEMNGDVILYSSNPLDGKVIIN